MRLLRDYERLEKVVEMFETSCLGRSGLRSSVPKVEAVDGGSLGAQPIDRVCLSQLQLSVMRPSWRYLSTWLRVVENLVPVWIWQGATPLSRLRIAVRLCLAIHIKSSLALVRLLRCFRGVEALGQSSLF